MPSILVNTAVVGTANANGKSKDAHAVLREAGVNAVQRRAAYLPPSTRDALPELAPSDAKPPCDSEAALQLAWLVGNRQLRLQEIWVGKLIELNMGLPYEWIIPILERGTGNPFHSHEALLGLLGERGKWMANQQNEWGWIFKQQSPSRSKQRATSSDEEEGLKTLRELRLQSPDEGRDWLIRNWDDLQHYGNRWRYLELLRLGLTRNDEVWLSNIEAGMQEGSGELVREAQIAIQLLSLLPNQALVENLCQKVFDTLHLNREDKFVLDFVWSVTYEGQWVYREHIGLTNLMRLFNCPLSLDAILRLIPLNAWTEHFMVSPSELFSAASRSAHASDFKEAWAKRILFEDNRPFAVAWLEEFSDLEKIDVLNSPYSLMPEVCELFEMLSWDELVEVLSYFTKKL
jgi:hypothetical protein